MKKQNIPWAVLLCASVWLTPALAEDFSGVYACTGVDSHEGKYTGTVTMKLHPEHSKGQDASYDFELAVPDYGVYKGHAAVHGWQAAMHFALPMQNGEYGGNTHDFGTGIAQFKKNSQGEITFRKFYFEPAFKGGNTGVENCVRTARK